MLTEYLSAKFTKLFLPFVLFMPVAPFIPFEPFLPVVLCVPVAPLEGVVQCPLYVHVLIYEYLAIPIN